MLIMGQTLFYIIVGILVFNYLLEQFLNYLNRTLWSNQLPEELKGIYDADKYKKSQDYTRTKQRFSILVESISVAAILLVLFFKGFAFLDEWVNLYTQHPILKALLFFGILGLAADILAIPFSLYGTFVIEEKFGFNKTTPRTFILDKIKGWLLAAIIGGGLLSLIVWIYDSTGNWFWLIAWGAIAVFTLFMSLFYSNLIVPLFNKQTPLGAGELREAIEKFAGQVGFKLRNIYVMDGSRRTTKANAYFTGLGPKKRIILFDTLIKDHTVSELVAVLAHEIGHYKKRHTLIGLVLSFLQTGLLLYVLSVLINNPVLSLALGASSGSFHMGVLAFALLYSPISMVLGLVTNYISRKNEFSADRFAGLAYDPGALSLALKKLSVNNLSNLRPHPLYVIFYYSHPPLLQRLKALKQLRVKQKG